MKSSEGDEKKVRIRKKKLPDPEPRVSFAFTLSINGVRFGEFREWYQICHLRV